MRPWMVYVYIRVCIDVTRPRCTADCSLCTLTHSVLTGILTVSCCVQHRVIASVTQIITEISQADKVPCQAGYHSLHITIHTLHLHTGINRCRLVIM